MPPNLIPSQGAGSPILAYPFRLITTSVKESEGASQGDLDCQCPFGITNNNNITSSKLFKPILTTAEKRVAAAQSALNKNQKVKKGVKITRESYLFRGIVPSVRPGLAEKDLTNYGTKNDDPVIRIYGLDQPIVTEDFLKGENKDSLKTVKIWLTVCFPSGEINATSQFTPCASHVDQDIATNVLKSDWRSLRPLVAFISYGLDYPTKLVGAKLIDKANNASNPPSPRYERRQVEAHVPIGEVNVAGKIVAQYIKTNLMLTDICFNGTPAKYPMPIFDPYGL